MRISLSLIGIMLISPSFAALNYEQHSFASDGYLRIGAGLSEDGKTQPVFQAPGARSKYRLGNEPDTNLEVGVSHLYHVNPDFPGPLIHSYFMISGYAPHKETFEFNSLAQAYVEFLNFFENDVSVWAGRRYYDRKDIHLTDHFWLNTGQGANFGVGLQGIALTPGELAVAAFRYHDKEATNLSGTATDVVNSTGIDLRLKNLDLGDDYRLSLWGLFMQRHENEILEYKSEAGVGFGGWLDVASFWGGDLTSSLLLRFGSAITPGDFNARPVREDEGWVLDEAAAYEINNNYTAELGKAHAIQATLVYRLERRGLDETAGGDQVSWWSAGARLVHFLSDHYSVAYEFGADSTDNEVNDVSGSLIKGTVALQLAPEPGYYERPVLRLFITLASWSDGFEGLVAPDIYEDDTSGFTVGAQLETWW